MSAEQEMSLAEACAATEQFSRFVRGLARLQDVATALRGADQAIADRTQRAEELAAHIAEAEAKLASITSQIEAATAKSRGIVEKGAADARALLEAARQQGKALVLAAQADADRLKGEANDMSQRVAIERKRLDDVTAELNTTLGKLEMARSEARKIIGG